MPLEHLFSPLVLGPVEIPNRIVSTAHQTTLVAGHAPTEDFVAYHEARARGGVGLIVLEATAVHPSGLLTAHTLGGYRDEIAAEYERLANAVHPHGTKLAVQLFHGGREQIASAPRAPAVAPSAVPTQRFHVEPRSLRPGEIEGIIAGYGRAAQLAERGGLDAVEISAAHGYLVAQFFTPELNRREDEWAEPGRFLDAVVRAVREAAGRLAIGVRLSADSDAARDIVGRLRGLADFVHIALGDSSTYRGAAGVVPPPPVTENAVAPLAAPFRIGLPLIATSRIVDPVEADRLIEEGRVDAVGMNRALITDPDLPRKAAAGRADEILRCIGCNACIAHYHAETPIRCAQNPRTGRERTLPRPEPAETPRRILVVGGGPAGLAAAAEANAAGHDVVLLERSGRLGGQIAIAASAPAHAEIARTLLANYERLLDGAEIRLGEEATADVVESLAPDGVVYAVGARPYRPPLALGGLDVRQSWDLLAGERPRGARIVVADWGGDPSGLAVSELLDLEGNDVRLVTASATVGEALHQYVRNLYLGRLYRAGVRIEQHLELTGAADGQALFVNTFAPEVDAAFPAELLVLALGRVPAAGVPDPDTRAYAVEEAGDCLGPRSLEEAVLEGTLAARRVAERAATPATATP